MAFSNNFYIVIMGLCLVSVWGGEIIKTVLDLLLAPRYGFVCRQISAFGFLLLNEEGKWTCRKDKFSPIIQSLITIDTSKPIAEDMDKKEKIFVWVTYAIRLFVACVIVFLCLDAIKALFRWEGATVAEVFFGSFALGMLVHNITFLVILIYTYEVLGKRLNVYTNSMLKKMRQGIPFEQMNLKPVSQLPYKNPSKLEKMMYYQLYIPYLIDRNDIEGLKDPIREMTDFYGKRDYIVQETLSYYWLIFYYSRYEINPANADAFFTRVSGTLLSDSDSNAKRVLAYYYFGVKRDVEKAEQYIKEGLAVIEKFSLPGAEREQERKLLLDLEAIISRNRMSS